MLIKLQGVFSRELLQLMKTLHFTQEYMKAVSGDELTLLIDINMTYLLCLRMLLQVLFICICLGNWSLFRQSQPIQSPTVDEAVPENTCLYSEHHRIIEWLGLERILKLIKPPAVDQDTIP